MRNKYIKVLSLFTLLSAGNCLLAQEPYFEEENISNPISEIGQVNGIAADANNCIWLTTQSGIYRYDGNQFRHYSILNTPALKFERMEGIRLITGNSSSAWCIKDGKGNMYVIDSLSRIQPFLPASADNSQIISGAFTLRAKYPGQNNITTQLKNKVADARFAASSGRFYNLLLNGDIISISIADLLNGKEGEVIYKTKAGKKYDNKIFTTDKSLYVVTTGGILRWENNLSAAQSILLKGDILMNNSTSINYEEIASFQSAGQKSILLWYKGNIYETDELFQNNTLTTKLLVRGTTAEIPQSVFYSPSHQILISCFFNKGLVLYRPLRFSLLSFNDAKAVLPSQDYYYSLITDKNGFLTANNSGIVWLGTNGSSHILHKGTINKYFLFKDKAGNIWYQQEQGENNYLCYLQARTGLPVQVWKPGLQNSFAGMNQVNDSTYYLLSKFFLIKLSLNRNKTITTHFLLKVPDGSEFNMLYALNAQTLWLGSDRGLLQYNIAQNTIKPVNELVNTYVRAVIKLAENNYLVGTYDKWIYQYKKRKWEHLASAEKNIPATAHAFIVDSLTHSVWVSSNEGILRIPLLQLLQNDSANNKNISFEQFKSFGPRISAEFNGSGNISSAKLSDTVVAFANAKGLVMFNPQKIISPPLPVNVLLEPVADNYTVNAINSKRNNYYNQVRFNPVIPYFGNREGLEVLYYFTNTDNNWHKLIPNSIISYNNLSPGSHVLQFRIKQFGELKGTQVLITAGSFYIPYHWYQTTWFKIAVSIAVLLLFALLHNLRMRYILKRDKEVRQLLEKYHLLFDNSPLPMWVIDPRSYYYLDVNDAAIQHYGYSKDEFLKMTPMDIRPEEDIDIFLKAFEKLPPKIASMGIYRHRKKDGTIIDVEIYSGVIIHNNKSSRLTIAIDTTEKLKYEKELQELSIYMENIREEERANISREIHDELGQQLTVLKMDLSWLNKKIDGPANDAIKEKTKELITLVDKSVKTVRRIASDLRPSLLDDLGLEAAMEWQLDEIGKKSGIHTSFTPTEEEIVLPDAVKTALFRIFQESLTNIVRHAEATKVKVNLQYNDESYILHIADDGKGFDKNKITGKRTLGILGMKERTVMIGGIFAITSTPGEGTIITITIPLNNSITKQKLV